MKFADAQDIVKGGGRVSREAWHGARFVFLEPTRWTFEPPEGHPLHGIMTSVAYTGFLMICDVTAKGCAPWSPQYEDMADDWCAVMN